MRRIFFVLLLFCSCATTEKITVPKYDMSISKCFKVVRVEVVKENPNFRTLYYIDTCRSR